MTIAATDLQAGPVLIEGSQAVARRPGRDNAQAVGLVVGILVALVVLAATVGARIADRRLERRGDTLFRDTQGHAPMLDWYRISDSNR